MKYENSPYCKEEGIDLEGHLVLYHPEKIYD